MTHHLINLYQIITITTPFKIWLIYLPVNFLPTKLHADPSIGTHHARVCDKEPPLLNRLIY